MTRRILGFAVIAGVICALPPLASAQDEEPDPGGEESPGGDAEGTPDESPDEGAGTTDEDATQRARDLFAEGIELIEQESFAEAAGKFEAALALRDAPAVRYNLALCYYQLGRYVEAEPLIDGLLADEETPADVREQVTNVRRGLDERAGKLVVEVTGAGGGEVAVDGHSVDAARIGRPMAASPGEHVVTLSRDGAEVARESVTVSQGEEVRVTLTVAPTPEETAAAADTSSNEPRPLVRDWRLWTGVAAGVIAVTVVVVLAVALSGGTQGPIDGDFDPGVIQW